ncbi:MAG: hypothetical protein AAFY70_11690 [Bacteroidota bacterium]
MRQLFTWGILLLSTITQAQINLDSVFASPVDTVLLVDKANLVASDPEGNLYTLDSESSMLTKYFVLQHYDSSLSIGGRSQRAEGLIHPLAFQIKNRQRLYVLDDVSRTISLFNTNLKPINQLDLSLSADGELFPLDMTVTPAEEIFVLNQQDNLVYKYSTLTQPGLTFGGLDYGEGALFDPVSIKTDNTNLVYIWDISEAKVKIYDIYGIYRSAVDVPWAEDWNGFEVLENHLFFWKEQTLRMIYLRDNTMREISLPQIQEIQDVDADRNFFYVLSPQAIRLYQISN